MWIIVSPRWLNSGRTLWPSPRGTLIIILGDYIWRTLRSYPWRLICRRSMPDYQQLYTSPSIPIQYGIMWCSTSSSRRARYSPPKIVHHSIYVWKCTAQVMKFSCTMMSSSSKAVINVSPILEPWTPKCRDSVIRGRRAWVDQRV